METPVPPSVSQDELTPMESEASFDIIRLSRGPSSRGSLRGGIDNPFAPKTCLKRNFNAYIKKVAEEFIKDQKIVNYPNYTTLDYKF